MKKQMTRILSIMMTIVMIFSNDIYNAAVNGIRRRNKGTDSKCI